MPSVDPTSPRTWREVDQIPGYVSLSDIHIREFEDVDRDRAKLTGQPVAIRWKRSSGLDWFHYTVVTIARVYGETHLLLEKSDGSRQWGSVSDVSMLRRVGA